MYPVSVGSAVKYTRLVPATKDAPQHYETLDATLIRYDPETDKDEVPAAHLVFAHPTDYDHLKDSNWPDAFQQVDNVPFEPEGEFYHGWTVTDSDRLKSRLEANGGFIAGLQRQILAGDEKIADLERQVMELQVTNTVLNEQIAQLKATPVHQPPQVDDVQAAPDAPTSDEPAA